MREEIVESESHADGDAPENNIPVGKGLDKYIGLVD